MLSSLLLFTCVLVNTGLIFYYLLPLLRACSTDLARSMRRCRLYFACRLAESRETALRRRCLKMADQVMRLLLIFCAIALAYSPSLLFASYRSGMSAAFVSIEALAGMSAAAIGVALLRRRA